jgi:hypothetical protein
LRAFAKPHRIEWPTGVLDAVEQIGAAIERMIGG